jgi:hypothetical protein
LVIASLLLLLALPAKGQYVGSEKCKSCHPSQSAGHEQTGHANSLRRPSAHRLFREFPNEQKDWAFGAGSQAVTFVSQTNDEHYVEHGLSWYARSKSMGLTPGHRSAQGQLYRTFDPDASILKCFQCHSTGPLRLGAGYKIEPAEAGVQCETCHGPAAAHVNSRAPIRNPKKQTAAQINEMCGACHRKPAVAGDDTDWTNAWNTRHQPLYLAQSACFLKSKGKLSCFTCHAPHTVMARDAGSYGKICASCHARPRHRTALKGSCVSCHMPGVKPQENLEFANHWIGVFASGQPLKPLAR